MLKRLCCAVLCIALLAGLPVTSLAAEQSVVIAVGDPGEGQRDWSQNAVFAAMQPVASSTLRFTQLQRDGSGSLQSLLSGADAPQALFKAGLTPAETIALLDAGQLIDLAPLLQNHAPNLHALLEQHPQARAAITLPDGRIGALPYINLAASQNCLWINTQWLERLGLAMPTTAEELQQVLTAFRDGDPNRNGRADEIPLSFMGAHDLKYLTQAFGLIANDFNYYAEGNQARFAPLDDSFRAFITWCRDLYQQRLLDKDGFTTADQLRRVTDERATPRYGAFLAPLSINLIPLSWAEQYAVVPPLVFEGKQLWRTIAPAAVPGTFALTSACTDPAALLSWVDQLYTPEGGILLSVGVEGPDYLVDGDGSWRLTREPAPGAMGGPGMLEGDPAPGVSNDAFQRRYSDPAIERLSAQVDIVRTVATDAFPSLSLTREQEQEIASLQPAIGRYVDESIARWVTGEWQLSNDKFNQFDQQLRTLGLERLTAIFQAILDQQGEGQP